MPTRQYYLLEADEDSGPIWNNHLGNSSAGPDVIPVTKGDIVDFAKINQKYLFTENSEELIEVMKSRLLAKYLVEVELEDSPGSYTKMHILSAPLDITNELHHIALTRLKEGHKEGVFSLDNESKKYLDILTDYWDHKINQQKFSELWQSLQLSLLRHAEQALSGGVDLFVPLGDVDKLIASQSTSNAQPTISSEDLIATYHTSTTKNEIPPSQSSPAFDLHEKIAHFKLLTGEATVYSLPFLPPIAGVVLMLENLKRKTLNTFLSLGIYLAFFASTTIPTTLAWGVYNNNFPADKIIPSGLFIVAGSIIASRASRMATKDLQAALLKTKYKRLFRPLFNKLHHLESISAIGS